MKNIILSFLFAALPFTAGAQTVRYVTYFPTPHAHYTRLNVSMLALLATRGMNNVNYPGQPSYATTGVVEVGTRGQAGVTKLQAIIVNPPLPANTNPFPVREYTKFHNLTLQTRSGQNFQSLPPVLVIPELGDGHNHMALPFGVFGNMDNISVGEANATLGPSSNVIIPSPLSVNNFMAAVAELKDFAMVADGTLRVHSLAWGIGKTDADSPANSMLMGGIGRSYAGLGNGVPYQANTFTTTSTVPGSCNITSSNAATALQWKVLKIKNTAAYRTYLTCNN